MNGAEEGLLAAATVAPPIVAWDGSEAVTRYGQILYPAVLLLVGAVGNTFVLIVLRKRRAFPESVRVYLCTLAISDSVYLGLGSTLLFFSAVSDGTIFLTALMGCWPWTMMMYVSTEVSNMVICALTIDRCSAIYWPLRSRRLRKGSSAVITVVVLVTCALLINSVQAVILKQTTTRESRLTCGVCPSGEGACLSILQVFLLLDAVFYAAGPLLIIVSFNIAICLKLANRRLTRHHNPLSPGRRPPGRGRGKNTISRAITLLFIITANLLVTSLPTSVMTLFFPQYYSLDDPKYWSIPMRVTFSLFLLNGGSNFFIYCMSEGAFRRALRLVLSRPRHKNPTSAEVFGARKMVEIKISSV